MAGVFHLTDGRALGYAEWGRRDGVPVLGSLGTSLSRLAHLGHEAPERAGVRLILVDRPGYGLSDFQPGRMLLDWPHDIAELADSLGVGRFAAFGMSGGGPHAAACGYSLPDRVTTVGLVSSPAPAWDRRELLFTLPPHRRALIPLAERDAAAVAQRLVEDCRADLAAPPHDPPDGDVPAEVRERIRAAVAETAGRGPEGYAHDLFLLFFSPWGFRPEDVAVPTEIWHGDADEAVSPRVAEFFAETIPDSRLHLVPGAGHLLLWSHTEEILRSLAS
jgi:pimeloyl-ACP methyl ester carboxylesterase